MTLGTPVRVDVVHGATTAVETTLRAALGRALDIPPAAVPIIRSCEHCGHPTHGRPRLAGGEVSFSVSHSATEAVIALCAAGPAVGVDLERIRDRPYLDRLAVRTLTPEAFAGWHAAPESERLERFLRAWTMKEAYLKAIGIGIATTLARVREQPEGWTVQPIAAPTGYVASMAVATDQPVIVCDGTAG